MSNVREAPAEFVAEMRRRFPDFVGVEFNSVVGRWQFTFLSAANRPTSQFWGWDRNPLTGARLEPDPVTGLPPFRDLDPVAQSEIIANCERTFIGNPFDGAGTMKADMLQKTVFNKTVRTKRIKERAEAFADIWVEAARFAPKKKHHDRLHAKQTRQKERRVLEEAEARFHEGVSLLEAAENEKVRT